MECVIWFRFLLLVVLLTYLVTATTVFGSGMIEKNDEAKGVDHHHKEVMGRSKWQRGREIGAVEAAAAEPKNKGQPRITSDQKNMLVSVTNMHQKEYSKSIRVLKSTAAATSKMTGLNGRSKPETRFHASRGETKEDTLDPQVTEEVFSMLHKDYQTRARRRPPINNAVRP